MMISKGMIKEKIDNIPEERLDELHPLIQEFTKPGNARKPRDFAKNIDVYISGESNGR